MNKTNNTKSLVEIINILSKYNIAAGITPKNLTALLEELGPLFINLGQIMSRQPNILPAQYCKELEKLQVNVAPMEFDDIKSILEAEYRTALNEIFLEIEPQPLEINPISQKHLATLLNDDKVVIKILRPGIYEAMYNNIQLIKKAVVIINFVARVGNKTINMLIEEIWSTVKQEMDFIIEAENAREFYANNINVAFATCPKVIDDYSTSEILVMEYIDGFFIDDLNNLKSNGYNLEEIAEKIAHNFSKQLLEDGFFHTNPCCNNIMIKNGEIVWINPSMMSRLTSYDKKLYTDAFKAIINNDSIKLTDFALNIGVYKDKINYTALCSDIEVMLNKYNTIDFNNTDLMKLIDDFISILQEHKIDIPKRVCLLFRAIFTIQDTLHKLKPSINFVEILLDYTSSSYIKNVDLNHQLKTIIRTLNVSFRKSLHLPAQLSAALRIYSKGHSRINVKVDDMSDNLTLKIENLLNKIVIAMIACALLIASSLICITDMQPQISGVPALGILGYLAAFILGVWILFSIFKKTKKQ